MRAITTLILLSAILQHGRAQKVVVNSLEVSNLKTTSIIFPTKIMSIDIGTRDVLAQRVTGTENVLQVKAGNQAFRETNLTVITESGTLHQFDVRFCEVPKSCYFIVGEDGDLESVATVAFEEAETTEFYRSAYRFIRTQENISTRRTKNDKIEASLNGIYVKADKLFLPISIVNESFISFQVESVRFFIKDKKQAKKTAVQEIELKPVAVNEEVKEVQGNGSANAIWVLNKLSLPNSKELIILVSERNGSRNIQMKIPSKAFQRAKQIKS